MLLLFVLFLFVYHISPESNSTYSAGEYSENGTCNKCPEGTSSPPESTNESDCVISGVGNDLDKDSQNIFLWVMIFSGF
jgi:hypothetical protein